MWWGRQKSGMMVSRSSLFLKSGLSPHQPSVHQSHARSRELSLEWRAGGALRISFLTAFISPVGNQAQRKQTISPSGESEWERQEELQSLCPCSGHASLVPHFVTSLLLSIKDRTDQNRPVIWFSFSWDRREMNRVGRGKKNTRKKTTLMDLCYKFNGEAEQIYSKQLGEHYKTVYIIRH